MKNNIPLTLGIDEVGRGPLAGPVLACALTILMPKVKNQKAKGKTTIQSSKSLKDSKKISQKKREEIYAKLERLPWVRWGIGRVSEKVIDKINIFEATKLAMEKAVSSLEKKLGEKAELLLIDGNFCISLPRKQKSIIRGDEKVSLIALASIVAKVTRDRLMIKLHQKYPQYGFSRHKGYGTKQHLAALKQHGPCPLHRQTFGPVSNLKM